MRRTVLTMVTGAGLVLALIAGTALANAKERDEQPSTSTPRAIPNFELEIDPELEARFGPRPVNAVQAAAIIADAFPGARVTEAELDERNGGPIWEMKFDIGGDEDEADVDAVTGAILGDDSGDDDSDD
jgi:uncharacterized membrane protein YkoI